MNEMKNASTTDWIKQKKESIKQNIGPLKFQLEENKIIQSDSECKRGNKAYINYWISLRETIYVLLDSQKENKGRKGYNV